MAKSKLCKKCKQVYTEEKSGVCIQCQAKEILKKGPFKK